MAEKNKKPIRELTKDSAAYNLLEYAFFIPAFTSRDATLALGETYSDAASRHALDRLLHDGHVEGIPKAEGFYRITERGKYYLAREKKYYKTHFTSFSPATAAGAKNNKNRYKITAFAKGAGLLSLPVEKPSFSDLVLLTNNELKNSRKIYQETDYLPTQKEDIKELLDQGIFYSRIELSKSMNILGINHEDTSGSKAAGIIVNPERFYVVYNYEKYTVYWISYTEEMLVKKLRFLLAPSRWPGPPAAIFTGKSYALAQTISMGYVHGHLKDEKKKDEAAKEKIKDMSPAKAAAFLKQEQQRVEKAKDIAAKKRAHVNYFSADNNEFQEVYYVPVRSMDLGTLADIVCLNKDTMITAGDEWFRDHRGFEPGIGRYVNNGTCRSTGTAAAYLPVAECKTLKHLRNISEPTAVVTRREIADCISHILGPNLAAAFDIFTGEEITVVRYDRFGYADNDRYEEIARRNRERKEERQAEKKTAVKRITISVTEEEYEEIKKRAARESTSLSSQALTLVRSSLSLPVAYTDDLPEPEFLMEAYAYDEETAREYGYEDYKSYKDYENYISKMNGS